MAAIIFAAVVGGALVYVMNVQSAKQSGDTVRAADSTAVNKPTYTPEPSSVQLRRGEFRLDEPYTDPETFDAAITSRIVNYQDMPTDLQIAAFNTFAVSKKSCDRYGAGDTKVLFEAISTNKNVARFTDTCTVATSACYFVKDSGEWYAAYTEAVSQTNDPSVCKGSEGTTTLPPTGVSLNGDIVNLPTIKTYSALKEKLNPLCTY